MAGGCTVLLEVQPHLTHT